VPAVAVHWLLPSAVAHISVAPEAYRCRRAATSYAAGCSPICEQIENRHQRSLRTFGLPCVSKRVPAAGALSHDRSSRVFQLTNSLQLDA
jgi:hypothetical protein